MSVELSIKGSPVTRVFSDSVEELKKETNAIDYTTAHVKQGTWIFYANPKYNPNANQSNASNFKIVDRGEIEDISKVNGSMYLLPNQSRGITLFEHYYYGGRRAYVEDSAHDVSQLQYEGGDPSAPTPVGLSAAIVLAKDTTFRAYDEIGYKGNTFPIEEGSRVPKFVGLANDMMKSIARM